MLFLQNILWQAVKHSCWYLFFWGGGLTVSSYCSLQNIFVQEKTSVHFFHPAKMAKSCAIISHAKQNKCDCNVKGIMGSQFGSWVLQVPAANKQNCQVLSSYSESHGSSRKFIHSVANLQVRVIMTPAQDNATNWIYPPPDSVSAG